MQVEIESYLAFLRYAIDDDADVPSCMSLIDWDGLLEFSQQQSIVGVMFHGMDKLPPHCANHPDRYTVAKWYANNCIVVDNNRKVFRDASQLTLFLLRKGNTKACVLKGQANALMYPDPYMRTPGDVDLWTLMEPVQLLRFVKSLGVEMNIEYHHIDFSAFTETPAEIHFFPSFMGNLFYEWRLRRYFSRVKGEQFETLVTLPDDAGKIFMPTDSFSRIFQLSHIMHHFFFEGIGLRQFIDYYYLLRRGFSREEQARQIKLLKQLNMYKFAMGVMWIMKHVLGLDDQYLLVEPGEKVGKMLLNEILQSGNFGHHDKRYRFKGKTVYTQYFIEIYRNLHFAMVFPAEALWGRPLSRWWHLIYKAYLRYCVAH